jgi:broad specificity phosphatase PhoE
MAYQCIYLMRHGHTVLDVEKRSDGWLDMPLSDNGLESVIEAQQYLKLVPLTKIITADLKRTEQTAKIVESGTISDPKVVVSGEGRTWNLGVIAGTKKRYGRPEVQRLIDNPTEAPMGGESFNDFKGRFLPWFQKQTVTGLVLYVGSGSNLRLIAQEYVGDMDELDLDEGGLACLHNMDGKWFCQVIMGPDDTAEEVS